MIPYNDGHRKGDQHALIGRGESIEAAVSQEVAMSRAPESPTDKLRRTGYDIGISITGLRMLSRTHLRVSVLAPYAVFENLHSGVGCVHRAHR